MRLSYGRGDSRLPPRHFSPSGRAGAVTPGQPLGFPRGSRAVVVPRTPLTGVVIPVVMAATAIAHLPACVV